MRTGLRLQFLAKAAGTIHDVDPKLAITVRDGLLKPQKIRGTFNYFARR
jgi:hypothetical protein